MKARLDLTLAELLDVIVWMEDQPQETLDREFAIRLYDAKDQLKKRMALADNDNDQCD